MLNVDIGNSEIHEVGIILLYHNKYIFNIISDSNSKYPNKCRNVKHAWHKNNKNLYSCLTYRIADNIEKNILTVFFKTFIMLFKTANITWINVCVVDEYNEIKKQNITDFNDEHDDNIIFLF